MKTYKNLLSEIQRLQLLAAKRRRKEVGAVIADIRQKISEYGITLNELRNSAKKRRAVSNAHASAGGIKLAKRKVTPKYRDPQSGATWTGRGLTPKWLAEKEKAGAKREDFLIKPMKKETKRRK